MDSWMQNMESVIKKWEKHGPPQSQMNSTGTDPTTSTGSTRPTAVPSNYGTAANTYVPSNFDPSQHRRKKKKSKRATNRRNRPEDSEFWYAKEGPDIPQKFQLIPPVLEAPKKRILTTCKRCQVLHQGGKILPTRAGCMPTGLLNLLDLVEYNRWRSMATLIFPHYTFVCERRDFWFPTINLEDITESTRIQNLIREETQKQDEKDENEASILSKIQSLFKQIAADISNTCLRFAALVLLNFFKKTFGGICYHAEDLQHIRDATKKQIPIIYLPLHKNHLDYIILSLILYCNDIKLPYVAAGDNLGTISLIGYILHKLGAFFICRNSRCNGNSDSKLYNAVLQEYVEQLLRTGQSMEIFIEGTRSRTGLSVTPKTGILSVIVNAVQEGIVPDVIIVPLNICYEKGTHKQPESIVQLVRTASEMMHVYCGRIHVGFGQPFTLQDFLEREEHFQNRVGMISSDDIKIFEVESSSLRPTRALGYHAIYDCTMSGVSLCTHMVSFLLLTKHRDGVTMETLEDSFELLKEKLETHQRYLGFSGNNYDVVKYAVKLLLQQKLVTLQTDESTDNPSKIHISKDLANVLTLSYYANQVKPVFAGRAVIACSILASLGGTSSVELGQSQEVSTISRNEVLISANKICCILNKEFSFCPPCTNIDSYLSEVLESFTSSEIIKASTSHLYADAEQQRWAQNVIQWEFTEEQDDWEPDDIVDDIKLEVDLSHENISKLLFLHSVLAPLLETYWLAVTCLEMLLDERHSENGLVKHIYIIAKKRVEEDLTDYAETASITTIRNAMLSFQDLDVIIGKNESDDSGKTLVLNKQYEDKDELQRFIYDVSRFR